MAVAAPRSRPGVLVATRRDALPPEILFTNLSYRIAAVFIKHSLLQSNIRSTSLPVRAF